MFTYDTKNKMRDCIIVDIDGTIAQKHPDRNIFDYTKVGMDLPIHPVIKIIQELSFGIFIPHEPRDIEIEPYVKLIFVSGRQDYCKKETKDWINKHVTGFDDYELYMRKTGDNRDDTIVKHELYENYIKDKFNVVAVFDDRPKVLRMWRELGLFTFNVAQHENEF